jgi:hypothetical protein
MRLSGPKHETSYELLKAYNIHKFAYSTYTNTNTLKRTQTGPTIQITIITITQLESYNPSIQSIASNFLSTTLLQAYTNNQYDSFTI